MHSKHEGDGGDMFQKYVSMSDRLFSETEIGGRSRQFGSGARLVEKQTSSLAEPFKTKILRDCWNRQELLQVFENESRAERKGKRELKKKKGALWKDL